LAEIATVCPYCGCGCGLYLHAEKGRIVGVAPSLVHPVSQGRLCIRGWHAHELLDNPKRLTRPLVRRGGDLVAATWDEAIEVVAEGLREVVKTDGVQAVGVLGSARCTNEDNYLLVRFARCTLGTPNIDCSLRSQCFPELAGDGRGFGQATSTGQFADLDESDLIVLLGSDPTEEHPAVAARVYRARQRGIRVITVSTRRHPLARLADVHLPLRPGSEVRLIESILHVLMIERGMARAETGELAELRASVADLPPEKVAAETGVAPELVREAAELYLSSSQAAIAYGSGLALSQEAAAALQALTNLAALSSPEQAPRVVLLSLLSRNNLQGCRDMGVAPDMLPGYAQLADDEAVRKFERVWGCTLGREAGLSAWQMLGRMKAMYVMGDDVLRSATDPDAARSALEGLKFLVVQDIFLSSTAQLADVVLPAAAFAERDGTWTSLERRVQRIRRATDPAGQVREDWRIIAEVSRALGRPLPYEDEKQIFEEIVGLLPIYAGVFYAPLAVNGGIRWPTPEAREAPFASEATGPDHPAARPLDPGHPPAKTSEQRPILLAADPTLGPWDGEVTVCQTMTVADEFTVADKDYPDGMLLLNPEDANRYSLRDGRPARVLSEKGEAQMRVRVTDEVPEGVALVPYHQAARTGLLTVLENTGTGRPMLVPTAVSVSPVQ